MDRTQFESYLLFSSILCFVLAIVNTAQVKKRGLRVWWMVAACIVLGITLLLSRAGAGVPVQTGGALIVTTLLVLDLARRPKRKPGASK